MISFAVDRVNVLTRGQRGHKEPSIEAFRLKCRGDPVRPSADQISPQHQALLGQELSKSDRFRFECATKLVQQGRVFEHRIFIGPRQEDSGFFEGLAYRRHHEGVR